MIWVLAGLLALGAFAIMAFVLKAPRPGWEAIAAALVFGIAGYALQAHPALPGAPKEAAEKVAASSAALIAERRKLSGSGNIAPDQFMVIGDAMARNGAYGEAAGVMLGAVEHDPRNAEAWLGIGNALVAHAEGVLSPAAYFAYQRASEAAPDNPGPPFFLGLALAQSGRLAEARQLWAELLARSPKDAPWRADLAIRLQRLDEFMAAQQGAAAP